MKEMWKPAVGCFDHVEVSTQGSVRIASRVATYFRNGIAYSQKRPARLCSPWVANNGYYTISVQVGASRPKFLVHRLVGRTFVPGYIEGLTINHIDGNRLNNAAENLEWVTLAENTVKQWEMGLVNLVGEDNPHSILTKAQAKAVLSDHRPVVKIAKDLGVTVSAIYKIKSGRRWKRALLS